MDSWIGILGVGFLQMSTYLLCNSVPFSSWTVFTNRVPFLFWSRSKEWPLSCSKSLCLERGTSWAFDSHSFLLSLDVLRVFRCSRGKHGWILHTASRYQIRHRLWFCFKNMFVLITLGTNDGLDCPFRTGLSVLSWLCVQETDDLFITKRRQILPWRVFPDYCFHSIDLIWLFGYQFFRFVEHLFHCEIFCIFDGMPIVWAILHHEYRCLQCRRQKHSPHHRMFVAVFRCIFWGLVLPLPHLIIHPVQEWSGF